MSSITFSGLGSGMDYASWVEQLVEAKKAETITPLETKKTEYENSKSALDIVKGYFGEFEDSIEAFTNITEYSSNDIFNQKTSSAIGIPTAVGGAALAIGFGVFGATKFVSNTAKAIKNSKNGEYDKAVKSNSTRMDKFSQINHSPLARNSVIQT